ncbi:SDR family oxidoreductase [Parasphingopyxis algicola]|uniref:SDR family NAD(P)-dependent oxidoreductase n=1 Tax=Parasphingopyxis algicola TaxID=2026624 RepID=UPI0015A48526|nr:SDR family oxidoreductase [Parasphingopyxis algicola]QLC24924.1 SDR family oxidoreductase [Parasphingopyxis algicola]
MIPTTNNRRRFYDKGVLISGGAGGIGRAASLRFAEEGARLAIIDCDLEAGQSLAAGICEKGGKAAFFQADVSNAQEIDTAIAESAKFLDNIDVLYNHAGTVVVSPFAETTDEEYDELMNINVRSAFRVCRQVTRLMLGSNGGSIVISSSICATRAFELESVYCMSKAALVMLAKCIATEYRHNNIRANAVCPAFVNTHHGLKEIEAFRGRGIDWNETSLKELQVRMCDPDEIAQAVLFLASDEAGFINGIDLHVDNGWSAHGG